MTNEVLVQRITDGETSLIPELWEQNKGFICLSATRFWHSYSERCQNLMIEVDDLIQVGYFALLKGIERYDPARGTQFLTALTYSLKQQFCTLAKMHYTGWRNNPIYNSESLDDPIFGADGLCLRDVIPATNNEEEMVETKVYAETVQQAMPRALSILTPRQNEVIVALYYEGQTFSAAAQRLGVSKGAVQGISKAALKKLRVCPELAAIRC